MVEASNPTALIRRPRVAGPQPMSMTAACNRAAARRRALLSIHVAALSVLLIMAGAMTAGCAYRKSQRVLLGNNPPALQPEPTGLATVPTDSGPGGD